ncbi:hypothetical protein U9M48_000737 [Paspalum notatum var. saurae]|uniref:Uncharacterized protein n=1 Tax=Paspalum notatum var. saurae TaxID=547442 RepID=A0AAQ3PH80_PASNO
MRSGCVTASISMVRPQLRCCTDDGDGIYSPHYVPIGPYHLNRSSPGIEKEKMRSTGLLQTLCEENTKAGLTGLMEELEPLARACYADGAQQMAAEQFTSMLLHDGCYLLHFFVDYVSTSDCAAAPGDGERRPATAMTAPVRRNTLVRDAVFLVENQIPLFVLERLHERVVGGGASSSVLDWYCRARPGAAAETAPHRQEATASAAAAADVRSPAAPELEEQHEQQARRRRRPVTAYCVFMSQVACTAEDVELLRWAGVVDHFLDDDEQAARGFAGLCRGVVLDVDDLDANYLKPLWQELEERCHSRAQRLMGWFRHGHNVGLAALLLVALILVACQVMQSFFAAAGRPGRRH